MGIIKKLKLTTFLLIGILLLVFSVIMFFYYLPRPGGESMASLGYLIYSVISIVLIFIDRILIRFFSQKQLSKFELLFLLITISIIFMIAFLNNR